MFSHEELRSNDGGDDTKFPDGITLADIPGNWPSCMPSCDSPTSPRAAPFRTAHLCPSTLAAVSVAPHTYRLASLRYDLSKLRAKGLVAKGPPSRQYRLLPEGYRFCVHNCSPTRR